MAQQRLVEFEHQPLRAHRNAAPHYFLEERPLASGTLVLVVDPSLTWEMER